MEKSKQRQDQYTDYYLKHSKDIEKIRRSCEKALNHLKFTLNKISYYSLVSNKVLVDKQAFKLVYELRVRSQQIENYEIVFEVSILDTPIEILTRSFSDKTAKIKLPKNFHAEKVGEIVYDEIQKQEVGIRNETMFLDLFLRPLKKLYEDRIQYVYHSGERKDLKEGVDYVIGYRPEVDGNIFKIEFQLKSSNRFFEKHKEKYPDISIFCFKPVYLQDLNRLALNFFRFLDKVLQIGVAYWGERQTA